MYNFTIRFQRLFILFRSHQSLPTSSSQSVRSKPERKQRRWQGSACARARGRGSLRGSSPCGSRRARGRRSSRGLCPCSRPAEPTPCSWLAERVRLAPVLVAGGADAVCGRWSL